MKITLSIFLFFLNITKDRQKQYVLAFSVAKVSNSIFHLFHRSSLKKRNSNSSKSNPATLQDLPTWMSKESDLLQEKSNWIGNGATTKYFDKKTMPSLRTQNIKKAIAQNSVHYLLSETRDKTKDNEIAATFRSDRDLLMETRRILDRIPPPKKQEKLQQSQVDGTEKFVDDFGNPLLRGANDDQIESFRKYREMSMETRTLLDNHIKDTEKMQIAKLARGRYSRSPSLIGSKDENLRELNRRHSRHSSSDVPIRDNSHEGRTMNGKKLGPRPSSGHRQGAEVHTVAMNQRQSRFEFASYKRHDKEKGKLNKPTGGKVKRAKSIKEKRGSGEKVIMGDEHTCSRIPSFLRK